MSKKISPNLIVFNGTSSSGKSSIAHILHRKLLNPPRLLIKLDDLLYRLPLSEINRDEYRKLCDPCHDTLSGYTLSAIKSGLLCIVDTVFEEGCFERFSKKLSGVKPFYIKVFCPLEILKQREAERGDRKIGTAEGQFDITHLGIKYDLELDTSKLSPEESVSKILRIVE
ncbi:MAG: hypothetical protein CME70_04510 [Halobacteriovorax sp.]|nr:hypothetical protein [Halobacteriovorax sp.]|tara:strand:+ start:6605 stop:7114 length:510 start_codon:yes stop_codon:yes gene_type:complete